MRRRPTAARDPLVEVKIEKAAEQAKEERTEKKVVGKLGGSGKAEQPLDWEWKPGGWAQQAAAAL